MADTRYPYGVAPDRRARLRPKPNTIVEDYIYGDGLMKVIRDTAGMVWLNTPQIDVEQTVSYQETQLTHTNGGYMSYQGTKNPTISVSGEFIASSPTEAYYMLACLNFLRSVTKMDFGESAYTRGQNGLPPPVLLFSAYGTHSFNNIPVVITSFSTTYDSEVDYVEVPLPAETSESDYVSNITENLSEYYTHNSVSQKDKVWIPQVMTFNVELTQQPTPEFRVKDFDLESFKRGDFVRYKGGTI